MYTAAASRIGALALQALRHPTDTALLEHTLRSLEAVSRSALARALTPVAAAALSQILAASLPLGRTLPTALQRMAEPAWSQRGVLAQGVVLPETDGSWSAVSVSTAPPPGGSPCSLVVHTDGNVPRDGWLGDLQLDLETASGPPRLYYVRTTRRRPLTAETQRLWRPGLQRAVALACRGEMRPRPRFAALDTRDMPLAAMNPVPADIGMILLVSPSPGHWRRVDAPSVEPRTPAPALLGTG